MSSKGRCHDVGQPQVKQRRPGEVKWQNQESGPWGLPASSICLWPVHQACAQAGNSPPQTHMLATGTLLTQRNFSQGHWGPGGGGWQNQLWSWGRATLGAKPDWEGLETFWEHRDGRKGTRSPEVAAPECHLLPQTKGHNNLRLPPAGLGSLPGDGSRLQDWALQFWLRTSDRGHGWPPFLCQGPKEGFLVDCLIPFGLALCPRLYLSLSVWPHAPLHDLCPPSQRCLLLMQLVGLVSSGRPGSQVGEHTVPCAGGYSLCQQHPPSLTQAHGPGAESVVQRKAEEEGRCVLLIRGTPRRHPGSGGHARPGQQGTAEPWCTLQFHLTC